MIEYIKGIAAELNPAYAVVENHGIGYMINISLNTYTRMQQEGAKEVCLYVYEVIREDTHDLYGFLDKHDRDIFLMLISVSGVGPNTARMIQSAMTTSDLENTIASGNAKALSTVKGIGAKTAQRIIVDLKDKINTTSTTLIQQAPTFSNHAFEEALAALITLGFSQQASQKALKKLFADNPAITAESAIKQAFKLM